MAGLKDNPLGERAEQALARAGGDSSEGARWLYGLIRSDRALETQVLRHVAEIEIKKAEQRLRVAASRTMERQDG